MKLKGILASLVLVLLLVTSAVFGAVTTHAVSKDEAHFELSVTEHKTSAKDKESAVFTVKNITDKDVSNVVLTSDLPEIFKEGDVKAVNEKIGVLKAGESKSFQLTRNKGGAVLGDITSKDSQKSLNLPTTGENMRYSLLVVGAILIVAFVILFVKHRKTAKSLLLLLVLAGGVAGVNVANAATTYHHKDEKRNEVSLVGTNYVFNMTAEGDFGETDTGSSSTETTPPAPVKYTVTFHTNGGSAVSPLEVEEGSLITSPSASTKEDYTFEGWYAKENLSGTPWNFGEDLMPANDLILYAKWEELPGIKVTNKIRGSEFEFAGSQWRILNPDIDGNSSNGYQALIIKVNALTEKEATGSGAATGYYEARFRDGTIYFSSDGSNGYEAGAENTACLKGAIDYYYENTITTHPNVSAVLPVSLNNPTYTEFTSTGFTGTAANYSSWFWSNWYKDTRFPTTLGDTKQAFALSYGDINTYIAEASGNTSASLLDFSGSNVNIFWLRSAGNYYDYAGRVTTSSFNYNYSVDSPRPVRPALVVLIR